MDRIPFQATSAGAPYEQIGRLPVSILLDNVRSLYNVGAFFRTADAAAIEKLYLCGITGRPPQERHRQDGAGRGRDRAMGARLGSGAAGGKHPRARQSRSRRLRPRCMRSTCSIGRRASRFA